MDLRYIADRFGLALYCLMFPDSSNEDESIAEALWYCGLAFSEIKESDNQVLEIREQLEKLARLMDTSGIEEHPKGTLYGKALVLDVDERRELRETLGVLANWFEQKSALR